MMMFANAWMCFGPSVYEMDGDDFPATFDVDSVLAAVRRANPAANVEDYVVTKQPAVPQLNLPDRVIIAARDFSWQVMYVAG